MKALMCENCGAPLNEKLKCEYCGTQYVRDEREEYIKFIRLDNPCVMVSRAAIAIDVHRERLIPPDKLEEITKKEIAHRIMEDVISKIEFEKEYEPWTMTTRYSGTLRVVEPGYRF